MNQEKDASRESKKTAAHQRSGNRGVTRPMMNINSDGAEGNNTQEHMDKESRMQLLRSHHQQTLWVYWTILLLGAWMILAPLTFSYSVGTVEPSGGRELWLTMEQRITYMTWSDIISGILLMILGWRSLTPNRPVSLWIACFLGIWISMAPLIFWSPTAVGYLNNTFVGALVIALTILIPGMPNMITYMKMGSEVPPGWSYNPSSWPQRWIMIILGFIGWMVSRYLGAFQLGYLGTVWDPFFGGSTMDVLNSSMSHSLPVSDGALGSLAYTFEFLMGWMGSPSRWRTMPWMVTFFGILVIPLGLVHIFLVISQPIVVGAWCTFCLLAATIMLPMIPLEFDEVIAMGQHMFQAKKRGDNMWQVFWKGGKPFEKNEDIRTEPMVAFNQSPMQVFRSSIWGMSIPWTLALSSLVGLAAMFAPTLFKVPIDTTTADIFHLSGALIVVISVISFGEIVRIGRYLNILPGMSLLISPWMTESSAKGLLITGVVMGILVILCSLPKGRIKESYGIWDRFIR